MIDLVYPLGTASRFHDNEIRFSLRSIEKHLKNYGKIYVIGERHPHLDNVHFIPCPDKYPVPDNNIMDKMTKACNTPEISENFLMVHDDHYLLQDYDAPTFPYLFHRTMEEYLKTRAADGYARRVRNTLNYLKSKDLPIKFFDIHTPIIFNKVKFLEHVTNGPDWTLPNSYIIKSLYANAMGIEGTDQSDNKTDQVPVKGKIFSTSSRIKSSVQRFLLEQFPVKCKFELRDF